MNVSCFDVDVVMEGLSWWFGMWVLNKRFLDFLIYGVIDLRSMCVVGVLVMAVAVTASSCRCLT